MRNPSLVDQGVVAAAEQDQVVEVGAALLEPVLDVVGVAPGGGSVAPGNRQHRSRTASALRWAGVTVRTARPASSGSGVLG